MRGRRGEVWLVRTPDGAPLLAKQISGASPAQRARLRALLRCTGTLPHPLVPFVGSVIVDGELWLLRAHEAGVALTRVAALSSMGQHQVAAIAAGCLRALGPLHAAGLGHGGIASSNVFIECDGSVRLVDAGVEPALTGRSRGADGASDIPAVAALVCSIWPEPRRRRAAALRELLETGRLAGAASAEAALGMLTGAFPDAGGFTAPDATLAALAQRLVLPPAPPLDLPVASAEARPIGDDPVQVEDATRALAGALAGSRRRRLRRRLAAGAGIAAVAVVSTMTAVLMTSHRAPATAHVAGVSRQAPAAPPVTPGLTPQPSPQPSSPPLTGVLQPAAPPSAGFISQAQLLPLAQCQPGAQCTVKAVVDLQLPHGSTGITWEVVAVDRCTGLQSVLATSSMTADPLWVTVWATHQITLPSADPALLYTVTTAPWRVASPPVAAGAAGACGPQT